MAYAGFGETASGLSAPAIAKIEVKTRESECKAFEPRSLLSVSCFALPAGHASSYARSKAAESLENETLRHPRPPSRGGGLGKGHAGVVNVPLSVNYG
jgi:hypothetical protein